MSERVAVITGANRGIGRAIAVGLVRAGYRVVMVCRRAEAGKTAAAEIATTTGRPQPDVLTADLSLMADVRRVADEIVVRFPVVQVLVNNAGTALKRREETTEGIEKTFATNHLAPFELTRRLLPALERGAPARVVTLSSRAQMGQTLVLDDLENRRRRYGGVRVYGETKLMNVLFTKELARRVAGTGITANCCHPGVIGTDLLLDYWPLQFIFRPIVAALSGTPEEGADTALWLATAPELANVSGGYFVKRKPERPNPAAEDAELAAALWTASERLLST